MTKWEMIFLQLVCWSMHPGYLKEGGEPPSLGDLARKADEVLFFMQTRGD